MKTYLFLNRGLFHGFRMENAIMHLQEPQKEGNVFFQEDYYSEPPRKWEVLYGNGYPNVLYDEEAAVFRCYYTLFTKDPVCEEVPLLDRAHTPYRPAPGRITSLCYAESKDGVNWEKPSLGLVEFQGSRENNILFRYAHGTSVFLDSMELDRRKRYKLMTKVEYSPGKTYMAVGFSEDGIHFGELLEWPRYHPRADSHNFAFRDQRTGRFGLITRIWKDGVRVLAKSESTDFLNWSEPVEIARGHGFEEELYSMPVFYHHHMYLGLASVYHEGDRLAENFDTVDLRLKFSMDAEHWDEAAWGENLIPRGKGSYPDGEFDCGCIFASPPVVMGNWLYLYYMGGNGKHTGYKETGLSRCSFQQDRLAYYTQKRQDREAILQLREFCFYGDRLLLLGEMAQDGSLRLSLTDKEGNAVVGLEQAQLTPVPRGWQVSFPGVDFTGQLEGKEYGIRICFRKARLYGIEGELILLTN